MANPVSIVTGSVSVVQAIINLALKIKEKVETFRHNREDCRKIGELVDTVRAVAEGLRKSTVDAALVGGALKALQQSLERAWDLVDACQRKNAVLRALDADAIAVKLRRVYLDVSLNLSAVVLANGAYNTSKLADINGIVAALRADVAYNNRMLAKILEIVAALPDTLLHLQEQVERLVQSYSDSTDVDVIYYPNESTRETNKTDDVARYSTYSSSYAYPSYYDYTTQTYDGYPPLQPNRPYGYGGRGWEPAFAGHQIPTQTDPQVIQHNMRAEVGCRGAFAAAGAHLVGGARGPGYPPAPYGVVGGWWGRAGSTRSDSRCAFIELEHENLFEIRLLDAAELGNLPLPQGFLVFMHTIWNWIRVWMEPKGTHIVIEVAYNKHEKVVIKPRKNACMQSDAGEGISGSRCVANLPSGTTVYCSCPVTSFEYRWDDNLDVGAPKLTLFI